MINYNIFLENTYEEYNIDEKQTYDDIIKMADFILKDEEITKNSCLNEVEFESISFDIVFTNNEEIHRINKEYREKDSPTDVITFAMFADSPEEERFVFDGEINLGEIIVSLDRIEEQAKDNNVSFKDELYFIISHGILHLLGYDHLTEDEYNFMVNHQRNAKAVVL